MNDVTYLKVCVMFSNPKPHNFTVHLKKFIMPLLTIVLVLIVVGVILWLINSYIPMDRKIKNILNAGVVIVVVIWLLQVFGLLDSLKKLTV